MNELECVDFLLADEDRSWWPDGIPRDDDGILAMAALASKSGMLPDCQTDADLKAAVEHGLSLIAGGVIPAMEVAKESQRISDKLMLWGISMKMAQDAESN